MAVSDASMSSWISKTMTETAFLSQTLDYCSPMHSEMKGEKSTERKVPNGSRTRNLQDKSQLCYLMSNSARNMSDEIKPRPVVLNPRYQSNIHVGASTHSFQM